MEHLAMHTLLDECYRARYETLITRRLRSVVICS